MDTLMIMFLIALPGYALGSISIKGLSLGTSGGPLLTGLLMGHFVHIGPVISVPKPTLEVLREVGLALFLMGAGTNAGKGFLEILQQHGAALFLLGALMTLLPMIAGYFAARKIFGIDVLNTLGSICGGMTSTPALGTLMAMTRAETVVLGWTLRTVTLLRQLATSPSPPSSSNCSCETTFLAA